MVRNWEQRRQSRGKKMEIVERISRSEEGLTFGGLLKATGLQKSALAEHLRDLRFLLIQEGFGRERKYRIAPFDKTNAIDLSSDEGFQEFLKILAAESAVESERSWRRYARKKVKEWEEEDKK